MLIHEHFPIFEEAVGQHGKLLKRKQPKILRLNIGKICNLTCVHCHVNAGPGRKEIISSETVDKILAWFDGAETLRAYGQAR